MTQMTRIGTDFYIVDNQADVESQHIYHLRDCGLDPQRVICVLSRQPPLFFSKPPVIPNGTSWNEGSAVTACGFGKRVATGKDGAGGKL